VRIAGVGIVPGEIENEIQGGIVAQSFGGRRELRPNLRIAFSDAERLNGRGK
jgi:hypothetical protein